MVDADAEGVVLAAQALHTVAGTVFVKVLQGTFQPDELHVVFPDLDGAGLIAQQLHPGLRKFFGQLVIHPAVDHLAFVVAQHPVQRGHIGKAAAQRKHILILWVREGDKVTAQQDQVRVQLLHGLDQLLVVLAVFPQVQVRQKQDTQFFRHMAGGHPVKGHLKMTIRIIRVQFQSGSCHAAQQHKSRQQLQQPVLPPSAACAVRRGRSFYSCMLRHALLPFLVNGSMGQ